jgi:CheY-like chemotaxis protein
LGLSIVYGIVRHSGGHLAVSSYAGLGSTFTVCMPASASVLQSNDAGEEEMFVPGTETLLVVEDEEMVRTMLASCLETCGYIVLEASNGAEALEVCSQLQAPLDLMITDSIMPKMSGKELSLRVRALFPNIPVLLMSGHIEDESETKVHGEFMEFLQKPAKPSELTRRVRDILDKKKPG